MRATEKQKGYLLGLQRRGMVETLPNLAELSMQEASELITHIEENQIEEAAPKRIGVKCKITEGLDGVRLGMCTKLVYMRQGFNMESQDGVAAFKREVKRLYNIIEELENEFVAA